jgi:kinesin family protein 4/21/27
VVDGYHATVFAYGQTGSGKTFTMEGYEYDGASKLNNPDQRGGKVHVNSNIDNLNNGISVRAIKEVFRQVEETRKVKHIDISCSFLQIYNEKVFDLLNTSKIKKTLGKPNEGLRMRWTKNDQFSVENLYVFKCNDADHCLSFYNKGIKNKVVASHNLNHASSRSHCIFTLSLEITDNSAVDN